MIENHVIQPDTASREGGGSALAAATTKMIRKTVCQFRPGIPSLSRGNNWSVGSRRTYSPTNRSSKCMRRVAQYSARVTPRIAIRRRIRSGNRERYGCDEQHDDPTLRLVEREHVARPIGSSINSDDRCVVHQ